MKYEDFLNESANRITNEILNEMDDWSDYELHRYGPSRRSTFL